MDTGFYAVVIVESLWTW